jgi:beta-glucanase (GH16 family)
MRSRSEVLGETLSLGQNLHMLISVNRTGSFDWTTDDTRNSYIDDTGLHIIPTLTLDDTNITVAQLLDGYTLNLTSAGICTSTAATDCAIRSNSTAGTIINPVRSARLTTKGKKTITYGRVEVVAKLPAGDWLWPAIW